MPIAALADSRHAVPAAAFLGVARVARQRIHGWIERDGAEMLRTAKDAKRVYDHRTTPVPLGLLESTAARWKALSRDGCLSQTVVLDRRDLTITDVRLVAAIGHCHQVADPRYRVEENEPSVAAVSNRLHLAKRGMDAGTPVLFGVAMVAIAEWYRLGFETSWEQLMADMADLPGLPRRPSHQAPRWKSPSRQMAASGRLSDARIPQRATSSWKCGRSFPTIEAPLRRGKQQRTARRLPLCHSAVGKMNVPGNFGEHVGLGLHMRRLFYERARSVCFRAMAGPCSSCRRAGAGYLRSPRRLLAFP
jgi:hypothetical protein